MENRITGRTLWCVVLLLAATLLACLAPATAGARKKPKAMVPPEYFSVAFDPFLWGYDDAAWAKVDQALETIQEAGIKRIRVSYAWRELEPNPPGINGHNYVWTNFDKVVGLAAKHGIRTNAMFGYAPVWAGQTDLTCNLLGGNGRAPRAASDDEWAAAVKAFAKRYGRKGSFWRSNADLPKRSIVNYEIWNEPNLWSYWCPKADPEAYAYFLGIAADELHEVDPRAEVVFAGMVLGRNTDQIQSFSGPTFIRRAFDYKPNLVRKISAVASHPYAYAGRNQMPKIIAQFREAMRDSDVPDSMPIQITEAGWPRGGPHAFPEEERVIRFRQTVRKISRLNCNINGFTAHAWITPEQDTSSQFHWHGLVNPGTLEIYPAGRQYVRAIKLMRGQLVRRPPRKPIRACEHMPAPDQDGDGIPDFKDPRPLRPKGG